MTLTERIKESIDLGEQLRCSMKELEEALSRIDSAEDALLLARVGESIEAHDFAFIAYRAAAMLDRNCVEAYLAMGQRLVKLKRYENAYLCLKEASRLKALDARAITLLAKLEGHPGMDAEIIATYRGRIGLARSRKAETPRRILVLANALPPLYHDRAGEALWRFCRGLRKRGHEVEILTSDRIGSGRYRPDRELRDSAVHRSLRLFGDWVHSDLRACQESAEVEATIEYNCETVEAQSARFKPDLCIAGDLRLVGSAALRVLLDKGIPVLRYLESEEMAAESAGIDASINYSIVTCGRWIGSALSDRGIQEESVSIVRPGVELDDYYRLILPHIDRPRMCYVGLMAGPSGPHLILEALDILKRMEITATCEFVGEFEDPRYKAHFDELIHSKHLEDRVKLSKSSDPSTYGKVFARNNILVMPQIRNSAADLVQFEAQAAGLAVIRSRAGGFAETLRDKVNGRLFETDNPEELARQVCELRSDPDAWRQICLQGQADAFLFDLEASTKALEEAMESLLGRKQLAERAPTGA